MDIANDLLISYSLTSESEDFIRSIKGELSSLFSDFHFPDFINMSLEYQPQTHIDDIEARTDYLNKVKPQIDLGPIKMVRVSSYKDKANDSNVVFITPNFEQSHLDKIKFIGKFSFTIPLVPFLVTHDKCDYKILDKLRELVGGKMFLNTSKLLAQYDIYGGKVLKEI